MASTTDITSKQLTFAVSSFIFGSTLLACFVVGVSRQDTWFIVVTGAIVGIIISLIYLNLMGIYPDKTIVEVNELVFGKVLGKIISVLYVFYFFTGATLNARDLGNFITGYIMPETPIVAVLILFIGICALAVYQGINTIARISVLVFFLYLLGLLSSFVLLIKEMDFSRLLPSFTLPLADYIQATHIIAVIPFGEVIAFTMVFKNIQDKKKIKRSFILGIVIAAVAMIMISIKDCAVLGSVGQMMLQPTYQSDTLISYGDTLSRAEVMFSFIFVIVLFFKVSVMYYAFAYGIKQVCKVQSYKPLVLLLGVIIIVEAILLYSSVAENLYFGPNIAPAYVTLFAAILPGITLIIEKIKCTYLKSRDKGLLKS